MNLSLLKLSLPAALSALSALAVPLAHTQTAAADNQCILAGRLNSQGAWAPQASGVDLLDATGKRVSGGKATLAQVKAVRLTQPALLSECNGDKPLPAGGDATGKKQPAPAVSAGKELIAVEALSYPPLKVGGELVELKLKVPAARVIALQR